MFQVHGNSNFVNGRVIYTWTDPNGGVKPITTGTIASFKFKAKNVGTAVFSVSGEFYDASENIITPTFSGTSVVLQEKTVTPSQNNNTSNNEVQTPGAGNSSNNQNATDSVNNNTGVSSNINSINQNTVSQLPNTSGKTSSNVVMPNNQTTNSNQQKKQSSSVQNVNNDKTSNQNNNLNVNLKELHLNIEGINPSFNSNITQYYLVVSNIINNIEVTAIPEDELSRVEITGNNNLVMGANEIVVKVISEDESKSKTYKISVSKIEDKEKANASLENLAIENVDIIPEFNSEIFEYNAEIESDVEKLNILAIPQKENAKVVIEGNENLNYGDNTILITVTAEDGITVKNYKILVHKKNKEENNIETEIEKKVELENDVEKNKDNFNLWWILILVMLGVALGIIIWFVLIKKNKSN